MMTNSLSNDQIGVDLQVLATLFANNSLPKLKRATIALILNLPLEEVKHSVKRLIKKGIVGVSGPSCYLSELGIVTYLTKDDPIPIFYQNFPVLYETKLTSDLFYVPPSPDLIKQCRESFGLTQQQCANFARMHLKAYQTWELGKVEPQASQWDLFVLELHAIAKGYLSLKDFVQKV